MGSLFPSSSAPTNYFHNPSIIIDPKLEPLDDHLFSPNSLPPSNPTSLSNTTNPQYLYDDVADHVLGHVPHNTNNPLAIVVVADENERQLSSSISGPRPKPVPRSAELVRVVDMTADDERSHREAVRRTRMIFDSVRVLANSEMWDERRRGVAVNGRMRGDMKAGMVMMDSRLWLNRDKRIVGAIPGIEIGDVFLYRMEMCVIGLHGQNQAGIDYVSASVSSNGEPIATSVIVSGGYEDDEDSGEEIVYTGHGGQVNNKQCGDQKLEGGNLGLERSMNYGVEVRVIRGFKYEGSVSGKVYVYDGLYRVVSCWSESGKSGFSVFKFRIVRIGGQAELGSVALRFAEKLRSTPLELRPVEYVCLDLSRKVESLPVLLFNDLDGDHDPMSKEYLARSVAPGYLCGGGGGGGWGCGCVGGCCEGCECVAKNGGEFVYDDKGILLRGKPLIYECGPYCSCSMSCRNRVSQKGARNRFEVFRSRETGWGVRSLDLIQAGAFICEYAGVVLTREQAEVVAMAGDNLVYPNRFAERWMEWGDLSAVYADYVRPSHPSLPPLDFAMDVSSLRNVACYISHSCSPNVMVQFVLYDHNNLMFPRLMLFALESIPPMRELSLDYGVAEDWSEEKLAICS